jgi:single-strand DNA-binding protein
MYLNKVTLIGFLGSNAEARNNCSCTAFSLEVLLQKNGGYTSHTEWHRCVVFGKLSEFAKTLNKGAHIQVEGELRSREHDSKETESSGFGKSESLRSSRWIAPKNPSQKIRMSSLGRISPRRLAVFTVGSSVDDWASIAVGFSL